MKNIKKILKMFRKLVKLIENLENFRKSKLLLSWIATLQNDLHLLTYFHEWNKYYMTYTI